MAKPLRRTGTTDPDTLRLEDATAQNSRDTEQRINQSIPSFIKNGKLISGIEVQTGTPKSVSHGLGKTPSGAFPIRISGEPVYFGITGMDSSKVTIKTGDGYGAQTITSTIDLWVY
jgi:hypothetical protein